jgi:hypothetical protein
MAGVPEAHQRTIDELTRQGFVAHFRSWAMGDTIVVSRGMYKEGPLDWYDGLVYLVPAAPNDWGVMIDGEDDDVVRTEAEAIEFAKQVLGSDEARRREWLRRTRRQVGPGATG